MLLTQRLKCGSYWAVYHTSEEEKRSFFAASPNLAEGLVKGQLYCCRGTFLALFLRLFASMSMHVMVKTLYVQLSCPLVRIPYKPCVIPSSGVLTAAHVTTRRTWCLLPAVADPCEGDNSNEKRAALKPVHNANK